MKSMTGFGKGSADTPAGQIEVEIKSVNQRFFDLQLRMPKQLNTIESTIRQQIKQTLQRGRIELYVTIKETAAQQKQINIQWDLLSAFMEEVETEAKQRFGLTDLPREQLLERFLTNDAFLSVSDNEPEENQLTSGLGCVDGRVSRYRAQSPSRGGWHFAGVARESAATARQTGGVGAICRCL